MNNISFYTIENPKEYSLNDQIFGQTIFIQLSDLNNCIVAKELGKANLIQEEQRMLKLGLKTSF